MKKTLLIATVLAIGFTGLHAQSTSVNFQNFGGSLGFTIPFTDVSGTALNGNYGVELLLGADANSLTSVFSGTANFGGGFFSGGAVDTTSMPSGVASVRVWDLAGGATYAAALAANAPVGATGGIQSPGTFAYTSPPANNPPLPPGSLANMTAIQLEIIPEPSTIALGILGVAGLLAFRRRK